VGDYRQPQAVLEVQKRVRVYLEGVIVVLSSSIKRAIKGADPEAINCPAALAPYDSSAVKAVTITKAQLTVYVKRCPESKIVLMGYPQVMIRCVDKQVTNIDPETGWASNSLVDRGVGNRRISRICC
jgi:Cutinase